MKKRVRFRVAVITHVVILCTSFVAAGMQEGKSIAEGVYTSGQGKRGETLYTEHCSSCHGNDLQGSNMGPGIGAALLEGWKGKTVADLYYKIFLTMPAGAPGTMTPEQTADIIAYMLQMAKIPAGSSELAPKVEDLRLIRIDPPK